MCKRMEIKTDGHTRSSRQTVRNVNNYFAFKNNIAKPFSRSVRRDSAAYIIIAYYLNYTREKEK